MQMMCVFLVFMTFFFLHRHFSRTCHIAHVCEKKMWKVERGEIEHVEPFGYRYIYSVRISGRTDRVVSGLLLQIGDTIMVTYVRVPRPWWCIALPAGDYWKPCIIIFQ